MVRAAMRKRLNDIAKACDVDADTTIEFHTFYGDDESEASSAFAGPHLRWERFAGEDKESFVERVKREALRGLSYRPAVLHLYHAPLAEALDFTGAG